MTGGAAGSTPNPDWPIFKQLIEQGTSSTFFFESPSKMGQDWMELILSSKPDPCGAVSSNEIQTQMGEVYDVRPSTATLSWTIFGGDTGVHAGPVPLGSPYSPPATGQFGFPELSLTPAQCAPGDTSLYPSDISIKGAEVSFQLDEFAPGHAKGTYSITIDQQVLSGQFEANSCSASKPNPTFSDCP